MAEVSQAGRRPYAPNPGATEPFPAVFPRVRDGTLAAEQGVYHIKVMNFTR
jgi:hypothetical protein